MCYVQCANILYRLWSYQDKYSVSVALESIVGEINQGDSGG